ncbi:MAG: DNA repair protein RecO [Lachnospira sp.]|nr:DNA repair protein RecO [Lachnospira sp.]
MKEIIQVNGIVLSSMPIGDYDNRLVILTKERGKISVFAKGARKMHSVYMAARPLVFGKFEIFEGRNSNTLTAVNVVDYFDELSKDPNGIYYAFYFMELADYFCQESLDESQMINLLYVSFKALVNPNISNELIKLIFEARAMMINGVFPDVFTCMRCRAKENIRFFDVFKGGMYCAACEQNAHNGVGLLESTVYTLQYISSSNISKLYTFSVSEEVLLEMKMVMKKLKMLNIDVTIKSEEMLSLAF